MEEVNLEGAVPALSSEVLSPADDGTYPKTLT